MNSLRRESCRPHTHTRFSRKRKKNRRGLPSSTPAFESCETVCCNRFSSALSFLSHKVVVWLSDITSISTTTRMKSGKYLFFLSLRPLKSLTVNCQNWGKAYTPTTSVFPSMAVTFLGAVSVTQSRFLLLHHHGLDNLLQPADYIVYKKENPLCPWAFILEI